MTNDTGDTGAAEGDKPKRGRPRKPEIAQALSMDEGEVEATPAAVVADDETELSPIELMLRLARAVPQPGDPFMIDGEEVAPGQWKWAHKDELGLPVNCPVKPLGKDAAGHWFLDPLGGAVLIGKNASKGELDHLFSPMIDYLFWGWPQLKPEIATDDNGKVMKDERGRPIILEWTVENYKAELARKSLFDASGLKGYFDPINKMRGRGCWRTEDKSVVFHSGDRIWYWDKTVGAMAWRRPGEIGKFIYSAKPPVGRPKVRPSVVDVVSQEMSDSARVVLGALKTWHWERPELDPLLCFGSLVSYLVCGALKARPAMWLSGETNAGKTELFKFIRLFMNECIVSIEKASAASIYQNLRDDCLSVQLDEQENSEDRRAMKAILDLILVSFSGGKIGKGGQDGVPVNYTLRSSFFMSGIIQASMAPANENRMVSLMIRTLPPEKATGLQLDEDAIKAASADIFGRLLRDFDRLDRTFETVRRHLARMGYEGRHQDTYGTLIACAHVAMFDHEIEDSPNTPLGMDLAWWEKRLPKIKAKKNWHDLYAYLMEQPIDALRDSGTPNIEAIIERAVLASANADGEDDKTRLAKANAKLTRVGMFLRISLDTSGDAPAERVELFIPNKHAGLAAWLRETVWGGGTGESGAWQGVLKQIPPPIGVKHTANRAMYGKATDGVLIDLREAAKAF